MLTLFDSESIERVVSNSVTCNATSMVDAVLPAMSRAFDEFCCGIRTNVWGCYDFWTNPTQASHLDQERFEVTNGTRLPAVPS